MRPAQKGIPVSTPPTAATITLADALRQAIAAHRAGHLDDAERIYRRILAAAPGQFDALHLLGVVAVKRFQQRRDGYFCGERADVSEIRRHSRHWLMDAPGAVIQLLIRLSVHRTLVCKLLP